MRCGLSEPSVSGWPALDVFAVLHQQARGGRDFILDFFALFVGNDDLASFFRRAHGRHVAAAIVALPVVASTSPAFTSASSLTLIFQSSGMSYSSLIISACSMRTTRRSADFLGLMTRAPRRRSRRRPLRPWAVLRASNSSSTRGRPVVMSALVAPHHRCGRCAASAAYPARRWTGRPRCRRPSRFRPVVPRPRSMTVALGANAMRQFAGHRASGP